MKGYGDDLPNLNTMGRFLESQISKVKELISLVALKYNIDLTGFDGFHSHTLNDSTQLAVTIIGNLFILLECYNLVLASIQSRSFIES